METIDKVLISLDPITKPSQTEPEHKEILVKNANRHFMEKRVRDLIIYMLDPNKDDLNPGYNESEQKAAAMIREWMKTAQSDPKTYQLFVGAETVSGGDPMQLQLENIVSTYERDILQSKPISEGGQSVTQPYIGLYVRLDEISGIILYSLPILPNQQRSINGR